MNEDIAGEIVDLQSRSAFQENSIQELSQALYQQQRRIDALENQVEALKQVIEKFNMTESDISPDHEIPPHY